MGEEGAKQEVQAPEVLQRGSRAQQQSLKQLYLSGRFFHTEKAGRNHLHFCWHLKDANKFLSFQKSRLNKAVNECE